MNDFEIIDTDGYEVSENENSNIIDKMVTISTVGYKLLEQMSDVVEDVKNKNDKIESDINNLKTHLKDIESSLHVIGEMFESIAKDSITNKTKIEELEEREKNSRIRQYFMNGNIFPFMNTTHKKANNTIKNEENM